MKTKCCVMGLVVLMLMASSAMAFDGRRKGFVLGGGLGLAPAASWRGDLDVTPKFEDSGAGLGLHLVIGYAWDNFNMIVYEGNVVGYSSDAYGVGFTAYQGFNGACWYHYFGPAGKTIFTAVGLGAYTFRGELDFVGIDFENDPGGGVLAGAGYEFSPHWQAGVYVSAGQTSEPGIDYDHAHINLLVSGIAF
jgi:hypothetical protein